VTGVAERVLTAMEAHDPEALAWCYAADATVWPTGWPSPAPAAEWIGAAPAIFERFPDLAFERVTSATDGGRSALELRMTGTDQTTGEVMVANGVVVLETHDDLVVRERHYWLYAGAPAVTG
jgi:hypothetical protein